jgi:UDP-N-acetylmuramate dehydrogenase
MAQPSTVEDVAGIVSFAAQRGIPLLVLGRGSNLLIGDDGFRGLVMLMGQRLSSARIEETVLRAEAGAPLPLLAKRTAEIGLSGLEFAAGIPGSLGGAIRMNAGTNEGAMADVIREVTVVKKDGSAHVHRRDSIEFAYRESSFQRSGEIVVGASLSLCEDEPERIRQRIQEHLDYRTRTQPLAQPSAGSVFRNPPGDSAGRLLDRAGCKGDRVGGAEVSPMHANWIVNRGGATARDIWALIQQCRRKVSDTFGVELTLELELVGAGFESSVQD